MATVPTLIVAIAPTLTVNDETGEWVMSHNITRVVETNGGSRVYTLRDNDYGSSIVSSLSPSQLRKRLFDFDEGNQK